MGESVELATGGRTSGGYLAGPAEGAGLGVVVLADSAGGADHRIAVCERFAVEGFTALAPDLGSDAGGGPGFVQAVAELSGAVDWLQGHPSVRGDGVGLVGLGTGAGLALSLAARRPDAVQAVVPFYGLVPPDAPPPDWSSLTAAVEGHFGEADERTDPERVRALEEELKSLGKDVRVFLYPGCADSFFDDTRPDRYDEDAARQAWVRTLEFLRAKLG